MGTAKTSSPQTLLSAGQARDYREWLLGVLRERQTARPAYSLRALAQSVGVSPATLSQVISGKRRLTEGTALTIARNLGLGSLEKEALVELCRQDTGSPSQQPKEENPGQWNQLSEDVFKVIAKWYHLAIFELAQIPDHSSNPAWIAKKLGISPEEALTALNRLMKLKLLTITEDGKLQRTSRPLSVGDGLPSEAIREHHRSQLRRADYSLRNHPMESRYFTSGTVAINPANLPKAQQAIKSFRRKLCRMLEEGTPSHVYVVSFQLFPVEKEMEHEAL